MQIEHQDLIAMKRERFLPAFLIGFFCLLALSSCVSESFLSERVSIEPPQTDRPEAVMLWKQMQEQPGSAERLGRALHKNPPLYEHTITASSPDFGVYYLIPYTDDKNEVKDASSTLWTKTSPWKNVTSQARWACL